MSFAPRIEGVKGVVPTPLKDAIKAGGRAVYYAPPSRRLPPRGYRLEDYKRWFPKSGDVFLRYLKRAELQPPASGEKWPGCRRRDALGEHAGSLVRKHARPGTGPSGSGSHIHLG